MKRGKSKGSQFLRYLGLKQDAKKLAAGEEHTGLLRRAFPEWHLILPIVLRPCGFGSFVVVRGGGDIFLVGVS